MKKSSKIAIGVISGVVVLVGGAYVAGYFLAGNQVPVKASANGVAIGGLSPEKAKEKLEQELGPAFTAPITLTADDVSVQLVPAEVGLKPDFEATVRAAGGGFSWNPAEMLHTLTGGSEVELVTLLNPTELTAAIEAVAPEFAEGGIDATVALDGTKVVVTPATDGRGLDVSLTVQAVSSAYADGEQTVQAVVETQEPAVTDADAARFVSSFADPLVSGPITLTLAQGTLEVTAEQLAAATTIDTTEAGDLTGTIDAAKLLESTAEAQKALELTEATDASFTFADGGVQVVPAKVGQTIDPESFGAAAKLAAMATGAGRTAPVDVIVQEPEFTTAEAEALGTFEVIGEFTTYYPHATYRNTNLGRAASLVNGTVLMPDEIFSLNDTLGQRTAANGFIDGYVISGGRLVKESGGGISQSATTLFNAAFFAGYKDIEHKPHSLYFDRYPAGREATIYYGSLDLRFQNDTEYPSYIRGYINPSSSGQRGSITFQIWSIPTWDKVTSTELVKSGFYSGGERVVKGDPKCEPQAPIRGFTVNWERLFHKDGAIAKREPFSWKYSAGDRIICEP